MSSRFAQRTLVLAAVTLVAAVAALALATSRVDGGRSDLPEAVPAPGGGWYETFAGPVGEGLYGKRTSCGYQLSLQAVGVAHAVLPCGGKVYVRRGDRVVLTQVLAREPGSARQEFGLTRALARTLGVSDRELIRWRFAQADR